MRAILASFLLLAACGSSDDPPAPFVFAANPDAARSGIQLIDPRDDAIVAAAFEAGFIAAPLGVIVAHWDASVPMKVPPLLDTEIGSHGVVPALFDAAALADFVALFPAGPGLHGFTIPAAIPAAPPEGDYHLFHFETVVDIPVTVPDATLIYECGFVFDEDGITTNNYAIDPPTNYFNGADRWYVLSYSNAQGWRLNVFTAISNGTDTVTEVASAARVILRNNSMILVVPSSEFTVVDPDYRVSMFVHDGDSGIPAPHSWSGNAEPRPVEGLQAYPG